MDYQAYHTINMKEFVKEFYQFRGHLKVYNSESSGFLPKVVKMQQFLIKTNFCAINFVC